MLPRTFGHGEDFHDHEKYRRPDRVFLEQGLV